MSSPPLNTAGIRQVSALEQTSTEEKSPEEGLPQINKNTKMAMSKKTLLQLPPLLRLPPELRNEIYSYVFPTPPTKIFTEYPPREEFGYARNFSFGSNSISLFPPLLRVSRQIRHETSKLFFSSAVFLFRSPVRLVTYLQRLPREFIKAIENIHLDTPRVMGAAWYDRNRSPWTVGYIETGFLQEFKDLLPKVGLEDLRNDAVKVFVRFDPHNVRKGGVWTADPMGFAKRTESK